MVKNQRGLRTSNIPKPFVRAVAVKKVVLTPARTYYSLIVYASAGTMGKTRNLSKADVQFTESEGCLHKGFASKTAV